MRSLNNEIFMIDEYGQFKDRYGYFISNEKADEMIQKLIKYKDIKGKEEANKEIKEEMEALIKDKERIAKESSKAKPKGHIYFVRCENSGVKIGKTTNVKSRFKALQTASPFKLSMLCSFKIEDYGNYELYVHDYFKDKRMEGEWFNITNQEIIDFLKKEGFSVE